MPQVFANYVATKLSAAITNSDTTISVQSTSGFPTLGAGEYFYLTIFSPTAREIVQVTNVSGLNLTVVRAQDSTTAVAWGNGSDIAMLVVAQMLREIEDVATLDAATQTQVDDGTPAGVYVDPVTLEKKIKDRGFTLLSTIDMTNGGANDLNNIDITYNTAWDIYDYLIIDIVDARSTSAGNIGFVASEDSGSTWLVHQGTAREAMSPTINSLAANVIFRGQAIINNNSRMKSVRFKSWGFVGVQYGSSSNNADGVYEADYNGSVFSNFSAVSDWTNWYTTNITYNGVLLRFAHEVGDFDQGTLYIKGVHS